MLLLSEDLQKAGNNLGSPGAERDKDIPDAGNTTLSGKFLSKVYEGNFKETGNWCKDFEAYAKGKDLHIGKWYMWYTTCPKCAKKYGKNYVAIIGSLN